jgi:hypothetical protein
MNPLAILLRPSWGVWFFLLASLMGAGAAEGSSTPPPLLKVLFLTGGGYHDYKKLAPHLTTRLGELVHAEFDVQFGLEVLRNPKFAENYAVVVYDVCDDEAPDEFLENALQTIRHGKPTVMIHCAVPEHPITKFFPNDWKTAGDELYQTISIDPQSHPLLKAKSPRDGREHVVCWTYQSGAARVFATTLGHDMITSASPEYLRLVANGLLWTCGRLEPDGKPAAGYSGRPTK